MLTELIAKVAPQPPPTDTSVSSSTATAEVMETSSPTSTSATVTTADTTLVIEEEDSRDESSPGILTCIHIYPLVVYVVYVTEYNSL